MVCVRVYWNDQGDCDLGERGGSLVWHVNICLGLEFNTISIRYCNKSIRKQILLKGKVNMKWLGMKHRPQYMDEGKCWRWRSELFDDCLVLLYCLIVVFGIWKGWGNIFQYMNVWVHSFIATIEFSLSTWTLPIKEKEGVVEQNLLLTNRSTLDWITLRAVTITWHW